MSTKRKQLDEFGNESSGSFDGQSSPRPMSKKKTDSPKDVKQDTVWQDQGKSPTRSPRKSRSPQKAKQVKTKQTNLTNFFKPKQNGSPKKIKKPNIAKWRESLILQDRKKSSSSIVVESPGQSPVRSPRKSPVRSPSKSPERSPRKSPVRSPRKSPRKSPVQSPRKSPRKCHSKSPVQSPRESPVHSPSESPVPSPRKRFRLSQSPVKTPKRSPVQSPMRCSVRSPRGGSVPNLLGSPRRSPRKSALASPLKVSNQNSNSEVYAQQGTSQSKQRQSPSQNSNSELYAKQGTSQSKQRPSPSQSTRQSPRKAKARTTSHVQFNNSVSRHITEVKPPLNILKKKKVTTWREKTNSPRKTKPKTASVVKEEQHLSDGTSFESLADDEQLPDIDVSSSPYKGRKFVKDDIVWAPYRGTYWPAIVTSVKWPYVCFLYVNESDHHVYRTQATRLISFDNSTKNSELKASGEDVKDAYDLVVEYLLMKKQNTDLNARRFLTSSSKNDVVGQARDLMFRITGKTELSPQKEHCEWNIEDQEYEIDLPDYENQDDDSKESNEEADNIKEILKDLETLPTHMMVSPQEYEVLKEEAKQLLEFIRSDECYNHLVKIRHGFHLSSRHSKYLKGERVYGGLGPFSLFNDLTTQLLTAIDSHCDKHDQTDYKHNVMLPEAIVFAIMKMKSCSKVDAKKYFNDSCKKVGVEH